jgi:hypothetical protein
MPFKSEGPDWKDLKLSARVFGHISQGLYRTPAGAIKELISNAFDADADLVKINTGFPRFDLFSCADNGRGLSISEFKRLMDKGLGTSDKHSHPNKRTPKHKRLMIGRLGIGLLSLAQICTEFDLISHHPKTKKAFKITLQFPAYTREVIDKTSMNDFGFVEGGRYLFEELKYDQAAAGVKIFTTKLRDSFRARMSDLKRYRNSVVAGTEASYSDFGHFLDGIYSAKNLPKALSMVSDYDQLIFGLGLIPALPYAAGDHNIMLSIPSVRKYQQRLLANDFKIIVDGMELLRPVRLPSDKLHRSAQNCRVGKGRKLTFDLEDGVHEEQVVVTRYPLNVVRSEERFSAYEFEYICSEVAGRPLRFWGYLFQQTSRIFPRELQGIIVRIRDVAIGTYDNSMMSYPTAEGPRYSMISGELVVQEGFEDALNIDRDSFNSLHPHYLRVQSYLHGMLHSHVFSEAWEEEKNRNRKRRDVDRRARAREFAQLVEANTNGQFKKIQTRESSGEFLNPPVEFSPKQKSVIVTTNHPLLRDALKKRKHEELVKQLAIAFERALQEKGTDKARVVFYKLLSQVFDIHS